MLDTDQEGDANGHTTDCFLKLEQKAKIEAPTTPELRGKSAEVASASFNPRVCKIWIFLIVVTSYSLNQQYVLQELNQMKRLLSVQLEWGSDTSKETWLYQTLTGVYNIGACAGAFSAGKILNIGRRKGLLIASIFFLVGGVMTQFMNFWAILFARLIAGFGCGISQTGTNRMIEEYVPLAMYAVASPFNIFMGQLGSFLALISAVGLPAEDAEDSVYADATSWHYIFGFTFLFISIGLFGFLFFVRTDTPKFYITKNNEPGALQAIHTIYQTEGSSYQANRIKRFIEKSGNQNTAKVSFMDSMWRDERYARASIVNVAIMSFHVLTGYSAVMSFSNTIFEKAQEDGSSNISARQGTYMVGLCNLAAAMTGIYTVRTFGRRTILLVGHSTITVLHFMIAGATLAGWATIQIVLVCLFIFVYMTTTGPAAWAYAAETCCDTTLAAVVFTLYFWQTVESFTTETLMEWSDVGTFAIFGAITGVSVVFLWFYAGETQGLSEKEKKEIFMPGATYGRPLKDGESPPQELGQEHKSRRTVRSEMLSRQLSSRQLSARQVSIGEGDFEDTNESRE